MKLLTMYTFGTNFCNHFFLIISFICKLTQAQHTDALQNVQALISKNFQKLEMWA